MYQSFSFTFFLFNRIKFFEKTHFNMDQLTIGHVVKMCFCNGPPTQT